VTSLSQTVNSALPRSLACRRHFALPVGGLPLPAVPLLRRTAILFRKIHL
jgi:hypothetical protein